MGKKPAGNSAANGSFGRIEVDPGIADKLDHAAKIARALKDNKQFRAARTTGKRKHENADKRAEEKHRPALATHSSLGSRYLRQVEYDAPPDSGEFDPLPSNHNKRDQGYNGWSSEWHRQAHTGMTGKPPKRRDRTDPMHSSWPFAPRK